MAEIRRRHEVIVAKIIDDLGNAWIIGIGGDETLPLEVVHRMNLQPWNIESAKTALYAGGKTIQPERRPSGAGFQMHDAQLRMPLQYATHDEGSTGQHVAHGKSNGRLRGTQARQIIVEHFVRRRAGARVDS